MLRRGAVIAALRASRAERSGRGFRAADLAGGGATAAAAAAAAATTTTTSPDVAVLVVVIIVGEVHVPSVGGGLLPIKRTVGSCWDLGKLASCRAPAGRGPEGQCCALPTPDLGEVNAQVGEPPSG